MSVAAGTETVMGTTSPYSLPDDWEHAITGWLGWLRAAGASAETIRLRRSIVRRIARELDAPTPQDVTTTALVELVSARRWSNDYRKSVRTTLISFYVWCGGDNPAAVLPKVPGSQPHPRPATDTVWTQLLADSPPREQMMARLAGEAGLRRAEVAAVHTQDLVEDSDGWSLIVRGKGDKQRVVPITTSLAAKIAAYPFGYLFPGNIDGHLSPGYVGKLLAKLMPPGWSMHKLRHRYASRGYAGTKDIRAVQMALGHASVATTQRYTAVSGRDVRAVSEAAE